MGLQALVIGYEGVEDLAVKGAIGNATKPWIGCLDIAGVPMNQTAAPLWLLCSSSRWSSRAFLLCVTRNQA